MDQAIAIKYFTTINKTIIGHGPKTLGGGSKRPPPSGVLGLKILPRHMCDNDTSSCSNFSMRN